MKQTLPSAGQLNFVLWQLADSAFPIGGFAHSNGLEAAWQHGEIRGRDDLLAFVEASLEQLGNACLPFMLASFDDPMSLIKVDTFCEAFTVNHVANRASRLQGRALQSAMERIFKSVVVPMPPGAPFHHYAPIFGTWMPRLNIPRSEAINLFFFNYLRSVLAAAVRLNIVGPMEAQILQHRLAETAQQVGDECGNLGLDKVAQTAPLLDLWQGAQDRLYSRLFQS